MDDAVLVSLPGLLFAVVFWVVVVASCKSHLFLGTPGRLHRVLGLVHLALLAAGLADVYVDMFAMLPSGLLFFHATLSISGTLLALSASWAFNHRHIKNAASGTLDAHALVTNSEMIEHSFYQGLNMLQVVFLHTVDALPNHARLCGVLVVQAIWLFRHYFPVNRFSDNYKQHDPQSSDLIRLLYRVKKWQYLFLKHALVFGLNVGVALQVGDSESDVQGGGGFVCGRPFRVYWLLLNASFVFEFFMQTLVRRRFLTQSTTSEGITIDGINGINGAINGH